jgi:hypothetical protein
MLLARHNTFSCSCCQKVRAFLYFVCYYFFIGTGACESGSRCEFSSMSLVLLVKLHVPHTYISANHWTSQILSLQNRKFQNITKWPYLYINFALALHVSTNEQNFIINIYIIQFHANIDADKYHSVQQMCKHVFQAHIRTMIQDMKKPGCYQQRSHMVLHKVYNIITPLRRQHLNKIVQGGFPGFLRHWFSMSLFLKRINFYSSECLSTGWHI